MAAYWYIFTSLLPKTTLAVRHQHNFFQAFEVPLFSISCVQTHQ
jgi:hypothetical protein